MTNINFDMKLLFFSSTVSRLLHLTFTKYTQSLKMLLKSFQTR